MAEFVPHDAGEIVAAHAIDIDDHDAAEGLHRLGCRERMAEDRAAHRWRAAAEHRHDQPDRLFVRRRVDVEAHGAVQHVVPLIDSAQNFRPLIRVELVVDGDADDFGFSGGCAMSGIIECVLAQTRVETQ